MNERPILFSGPMVRAILDGRKTQTRRVVKLDENPGHWHTFSRCDSDGSWIAWGSPAAHGSQQQYDEFTQRAYPHGGGIRCPYGVPGDRLLVREALHCDDEIGWCYSADDAPIESNDDEAIAWLETRPARKSCYPSIHMPRWASRITLEVVSVRVERLNEIGEEDAIAEGSQCAGVPASLTNRGAFAKLWDSINGNKHPWSSNPWVWVVEFKRLEAKP